MPSGERTAADYLRGGAVANGPAHSNSGGEPILTRIGKYEIQAEIGNGVRIKAFRAFDPQTDRRVTLKFLMDVTDAALTERFHREVAITAKIASPAFAALYEVGEHVGFPFAAMQCAGDRDFRAVLEQAGALSRFQKVSMIWQISEGARAAHLAGLPYIGLRPSAIALSEQARPVIQDFGIVRPTPEEGDWAAAYAAPEEAAGESPDALCDIFAFGRLCSNLLESRDQQLSLDDAVADADSVELLSRVLRRALARERALRYRNFEEIQEDLEPVFINLRRAKAAELLSDARACVESGDYEQANSVVREALEIDPHNVEADRLRLEVRGLLKRQVARPRIENVLIAAEDARRAQDYDRANEIINSAVILGVSDADLVSRIEASRNRIANSREALKLVEKSRGLLGQERLEEAKAAALRAASIDPECSAAAEALGEIEEALRLRERESLAERGLAQAKSLLLLERFDQAIATLQELRDKCPGNAGIEQWLERASEQKAASEKKSQIELRVSEVRTLLGKGDFDMALGALEAMAERFPDADFSDLASRAQLERQVAQALDESGWLLEQGRPDLALQFLREKAKGVEGDARFAARLAEVEAALQAWEKRRSIEECLRQVDALEQMEQYPVALTVLEDALSANPGSDELRAAAERVRGRAAELERQRKLNRRLELIRRKMAAQDWPQALAVIASALAEFPGESELLAFESASRAALADATAASIASEVRQAIADGESETAGRLLMEGLQELPDHPLLLSLKQAAEEEKRFREDWRTAQVLFARRQFEQAETILVRLAESDRPEVLALLELVREGRAATEEAEFYDRGVDKATKLLQEKQFEQAADLLRNLMALFPGDAILRRHLAAATRGGRQEADRRAPDPNSAALKIEETEPKPPEAPPEAAQPVIHAQAAPGLVALKRRISRIVPAACLLLLVSFGAISWFGSRDKAPAKIPAAGRMPKAEPPAAVPAAVPAPTPVAAPAPAESAAAEPAEASAPDRADTLPRAQAQQSRAPSAASAARPVRPFNVSSLRRPNAQTSTVLAPPAAVAAEPSQQTASALLDSMGRPTPPPAPPNGKSSSGATKQSSFTPATVVTRVAPQLSPQVARSMQGTVELEALIDSQGVVKDVKVISGNPILAAAAKEAVLKWRYQPAILNGQPVEESLVVRVNFSGRK